MSSAPAAPRGWPVERVLFAVAGTVTLLSVALTALVSPWFAVPAAVVGVCQWLYVLAGGGRAPSARGSTQARSPSSASRYPERSRPRRWE
jgi:hypothetical protein